MHLKRIQLCPDRYPTREHYPFNLRIFQRDQRVPFPTPVTFFLGENGTGKTTLLKAISHRCGIHIWESYDKPRVTRNPYEREMYRAVEAEWTDGMVPGSFFGSQIFRNFAQLLDEWATTDPGLLEYFGGSSLLTQSHGQSLMSFFTARYQRKGLYLMDEPETALSPRSQLRLLQLLHDMGRAGHAQFLVATHSPILLACPDATLYSFDFETLRRVGYEETDHYRIYRRFMEDPERHLDGKP